MKVTNFSSPPILEYKRCIVCNISFLRRTRPKKHKGYRSTKEGKARHIGAVTCSHKCSTDYIHGKRYNENPLH